MDSTLPDPSQRPRLRPHPGAPEVRLTVSAAPAVGMTHAWGSARADGRVAAIDTNRKWRRRAAVQIGPDPFVPLLLGGGERLVACSDSRWSVIDAPAGRVLGGGLRVDGVLTLDAAGRALFAPTEAGTIDVIDLASGAVKHVLKARFGDAYRRVYVDACGPAVVIGSVRLPKPHGAAPGDLDAVVERLELDAPPVVGAQGLVKARRTALFEVTPNPLFVGSAERLVCVRPGLIDWFDGSLKPLASLAGEFTARSICLPDDEHLLMTVELPGGVSELWAVDRGGEVQLLCNLKGRRALQPPIVASATRLYVLSELAIVAVDLGKGGIAWEQPHGGVRCGLAAGANALLIVAGNTVQVVHENHKVETLLACDGPIRSNPLPLASGEIAVATEGEIHLFEGVPAGAR